MESEKENVLKVNSFNDVENIAKKLNERNSIVIEVTANDPNIRTRIIDFVAGLVYYKGEIKKLEAKKFRITLDKNIV
jgi:FtsZ-interacting cell division protein YlmF